ncbi:MAG: hypothetical protein Q9219_005626 [cf. Caloplaca sp. 3 TL-2023]
MHGHKRRTANSKNMNMTLEVLIRKVVVHGLPNSSSSAPGILDTIGTFSEKSEQPQSIQPPSGFSCSFRRGGRATLLPSRDLYAATLQGLLHFSLKAYGDNANRYITRGTNPPRNVEVTAEPFILPTANTMNCHLAWGLYRSVIAFNNPDNTRETIASIRIHGVQVADLDFLEVLSPSTVAAKEDLEDPADDRPITNLTSATALKLLASTGTNSTKRARAPASRLRYSMSWHAELGGAHLRRQSAYDAIAYAILWTSQFPESASVTGHVSCAVPGGRIVVRFMSYSFGGLGLMTYGFVATILRSLPDFLEGLAYFQEAFVTISLDDGRHVGQIGIYKITRSSDDQ